MRAGDDRLLGKLGVCTVSVINDPLTGGNQSGWDRRIRIACNRDESRTRPSALPPQVRLFGLRQAIMPIDPLSDGSWIAVNDAGVAASLLNVYNKPAKGQSPKVRFKSRGVIIPRLMTSGSALAAASLAQAIDAHSFPPFRLVIVDEDTVCDMRSDGDRLQSIEYSTTTGPWMFTSSGLGDDIVEPPRRQLFEEMLVQAAAENASIGNSIDRQDAFHRFRWKTRPEISVCMTRSDARTVSYTVVDIDPTKVTLTYFPDAPDQDPAPIAISIGRRHLP